MRRREPEPGPRPAGHLPQEDFPAFVVEDWLGRIEPGKPVDATRAFYAYSQARRQWCRDRGINSYRYIHGKR
ncbi:hypothetical protein [Rhodococcoides fascians]|uniref:hypothetical protein n=1 Tax=Rhodococcoides fascians TaxID=1828 RepID=UPI0037AE928B